MLAIGVSACDDAANAASTEACDAFIGINLAFASDEPDPAAIGRLLDTLEDSKPDEVSDDMQVMINAGRDVVETQDFAAFERDEFVIAESAVDPFMFEHCRADTKVEVIATDYAFAGVPASVPAGRVAVLLDNPRDTREFHEIVVVRRNDGVTEPFGEILQLSDDEIGAQLDIVGATSAPPGAKGATWVDLTPGDYALVCPILQGTSHPGHEGDGSPHFLLGMLTEFVVE